MINRVVLIGRITRDPTLRKTQKGISVCTFTLACNRKIKQQGQPDADFINCIAWNKAADFMCQYVRKGALLGIDGRIQTRNYDDKDGKKVFVTEVIANTVHSLESKKNAANMATVPDYEKTTGNYDNQGFNDVDTIDIASDDLPF